MRQIEAASDALLGWRILFSRAGIPQFRTRRLVRDIYPGPFCETLTVEKISICVVADLENV